MPESKNTNQFWNIVTSDDGDSAEITLHGDICARQPVDFWTGEAIKGNFITPEGFAKDLEKIKGKSKITVHINSVGGDLFTGIAIHNSLKALPGHKTVIVDAVAASAASVIMCAGDDIKVYEGSIIMVHGVSTVIRGSVTKKDLEKMKNAMTSMEGAIASIYSKKTGKDIGELQNMIDEETWMYGKNAVEAGFADSLIEGDMKNELQLVASLSGENRLMFGNDVISKDFRAKLPDGISIPVVNESSPANSAFVDDNEKLRAENKKLLVEIEELKNNAANSSAPVNNQEAIDAALKADRERLAGIDSIAAGLPAELVAKAKYGSETTPPMTPEQLALEAMKNGATAGSSYLNARAQEVNASGASSVVSTPGENDDLQAAIKAAAAAGQAATGIPLNKKQ